MTFANADDQLESKRGAGGLRNVRRTGLGQDRLQLHDAPLRRAPHPAHLRVPYAHHRRRLAATLPPLLVAHPSARRAHHAGDDHDHRGARHDGHLRESQHYVPRMIVAVAALKGGGRRTTTSVDLAAVAGAGRRAVTLIDADAQASSAEW